MFDTPAFVIQFHNRYIYDRKVLKARNMHPSPSPDFWIHTNKNNLGGKIPLCIKKDLEVSLKYID